MIFAVNSVKPQKTPDVTSQTGNSTGNAHHDADTSDDRTTDRPHRSDRNQGAPCRPPRLIRCRCLVHDVETLGRARPGCGATGALRDHPEAGRRLCSVPPACSAQRSWTGDGQRTRRKPSLGDRRPDETA
jgi:hypothetical protein